MLNDRRGFIFAVLIIMTSYLRRRASLAAVHTFCASRDGPFLLIQRFFCAVYDLACVAAGLVTQGLYKNSIWYGIDCLRRRLFMTMLAGKSKSQQGQGLLSCYVFYAVRSALQKFESFIFLADKIFYRSCIYLQHFCCAVPCLMFAFGIQGKKLGVTTNFSELI